jgi:hypothetical protein
MARYLQRWATITYYGRPVTSALNIFMFLKNRILNGVKLGLKYTVPPSVAVEIASWAQIEITLRLAPALGRILAPSKKSC